MTDFPPNKDLEPRDPKKPSQGRVMLWIVGAGVGLYFVISGIWGLLTNG